MNEFAFAIKSSSVNFWPVIGSLAFIMLPIIVRSPWSPSFLRISIASVENYLWADSSQDRPLAFWGAIPVKCVVVEAAKWTSPTTRHTYRSWQNWTRDEMLADRNVNHRLLKRQNFGLMSKPRQSTVSVYLRDGYIKCEAIEPVCHVNSPIVLRRCPLKCIFKLLNVTFESGLKLCHRDIAERRTHNSSQNRVSKFITDIRNVHTNVRNTLHQIDHWEPQPVEICHRTCLP